MPDKALANVDGEADELSEFPETRLMAVAANWAASGTVFMEISAAAIAAACPDALAGAAA